jgi:hypothetical protein
MTNTTVPSGWAPPQASTPIRSLFCAFVTDITRAVVNQAPVAELSAPVPATGQRAPKASAISREAIEKARSNIEKLPQKCTLLDTLIEIQE